MLTDVYTGEIEAIIDEIGTMISEIGSIIDD